MHVLNEITPQEISRFRHLTIFFSLLTVAISILGLLTAQFSYSPIGGVNLGYRTIALSASLIWIFFGLTLTYHTIKPLGRIAGLGIQVILVLIAILEVIEFLFSVQGGHFFIETLFTRTGTLLFGTASMPISPVAAGFAVLATIALTFLIRNPTLSLKPARVTNVVSIIGLSIFLVSITFVMSYFYGEPLLYGSKIIPIAFISALAAVFVGISIISAAGPEAFPVRYFIGNSTTTCLLRAFVPLVICIVFFEYYSFTGLFSAFNIRNPVLLSMSLVVFTIITGYVVIRISRGVGRVLEQVEEELIRNNQELCAMNEELMATEEELRQANYDLLERERQVLQKNEDLSTLYEELTCREQDLNKTLLEKEVLLSEIHHRVKNNLTAFISLLSLEGSTEDTHAGKMLKQDLQNRARSMALIHETLYRTNMYNEVDMGIYLTTLVDQISNSFGTTRQINTVVNAQGIMLDIPRATPAGLIVNELVTNSFKYAFPESLDTRNVRNEPPTITLALSRNDNSYVLSVRDNGIGLTPGFDIQASRTLGLKLVNFLARHQMQANIKVNSQDGTEFIFRFGKNQE